MTDTEHNTTSGSNEEDSGWDSVKNTFCRKNIFKKTIFYSICYEKNIVHLNYCLDIKNNYNGEF